MLVATSTLFATNAYHALVKGHVFYGGAFSCLVLTSWWYHYDGKYNNRRAFICDQAAMLSVVFTGAYNVILSPVDQAVLPVLFFLATCLTYKLDIGHWLVHVLASVGHHFIIAAGAT